MVTTTDRLLDIQEKLGALVEGQKQTVISLESGAVARKALYDRQEKLAEQLAEVSNKADLAVTAAALVRQETQEFHKKMEPISQLVDELPKMVEGWNDLRKSSARFLWFLGIGGPVILTAMVWVASQFTGAVQRWLGIIPPQ